MASSGIPIALVGVDWVVRDTVGSAYAFDRDESRTVAAFDAHCASTAAERLAARRAAGL